jgi:addiction module RelB/DinJ family antitoxin
MANNSIIQIRLDSDLKDQAIIAFNEMGLSISEGIRLLIAQVAKNRDLSESPFAEGTAPVKEFQHKVFNDIDSRIQYPNH